MTFRCPRRKDTVSSPSRPTGREGLRFSRPFPVGTQWETCGKNRQQGLGTKGLPQKKVLSLVLCVAMMLSVMVMSTGATSFSDEDEFSPQYKEAAEVLTGMGVMQGYEDGSYFLPQRNITRAQVATLIYRAVTGDVKDTQTDLYKDWNKFKDVPSTDWSAGYVNYCANGEIIKGFTPDTFGPLKNVTGYQVLAMILRAIGYDANDEFTGEGWEVRTATTAKEIGLLDNVQDTTLGVAASRELVAELIFQAMKVPMVKYNLIVKDYVPVKGNETLGEKEFDLTKGDRTAIDEWGRPGYEWYADSNNNNTLNDKETVYATIEEAALATYETAVTECDVASDYGFTSTKSFDTYTNGAENKGTDTLNALATTATIGEQGRLTEVYTDRIVYIDTYFAVVTSVSDAKFDAAGHLAKAATMKLDVYDANNESTQVTLTNDDTNWEYTVGQALLVNAKTVRANSTKVDNSDGQHVEIVDVATSFVGSQSRIWTNAAQHTIDGTDYDDAYCFFRDDAGNQTIRFNWWLDQYGNLIAATPVDRDSYAVLKDLTWIVGHPGYAEATLINMDGTEYTAVVNTMDGDMGTAFAGWDTNDVGPNLADANNVTMQWNSANVSSDSRYNAMYLGYALYQVTTNDDGTVNLNGYVNDGNNTWNDVATDTVVDYHANTTVDTTASAILDGNDDVLIHLDDSTLFVVRTGTAATGYTYTTYTGTDELPQYVAETADVFFDGVHSDDRIADVVYIKDANLEADFGDYLFTVTDNYYQIAGTNLYRMTVVVDDVEREIATSLANVQFLADNVGKLFQVTWVTDSALTTYGEVNTVALVNEHTDNDNSLNYMAQAITVGNGTLLCNGVSYNITDATVVSTVPGVSSYTDITKDVVDEYGVWVVSETAPYKVATTVYVGTKLSSDVTLTVTSPKGVESYSATTHTWTVDFNGVDTNDTLTYDAYTYAWIDSPTNDGFGSVTDYVMNQNGKRSVTVYAEDGLTVQSYEVILDWSIDAKDFIDYIADYNNMETVLYNGEGLCYRDIDDAIDNAQELNYGSATSARLMVESEAPETTAITYRNFESTADIETSQVDQDLKATGEIKAANAGQYLVISITDADDTWYSVFQIVE